MTTEKALREALQALVDAEDWRRQMPRSGTDHMQREVALKKAWIDARAALSLPETQGEPVAGDVEWLHKFINCTPFGADAPAEDMQRAHRIVDSLYAAPPSQPARGGPVAWREHVEQRLHSWRQSFINETGDKLSLRCFMDKESVDDLIDYVCSEYAAPAAPTQEGWRPIETAPKDGTWFLAYRVQDIKQARWMDDWMPSGKRVLGGHSWCYAKESMPSHWMPLPAKPTNGGEG